MKRRVIHIDEEKCTGCGLCVHACHEGAIGLVGGKARLLRDDYCDGLGDCLPACPENAIEFIEREAAAYDEAAVIAEKMRRGTGRDSWQACPRRLSWFHGENDCARSRAGCGVGKLPSCSRPCREQRFDASSSENPFPRLRAAFRRW